MGFLLGFLAIWAVAVGVWMLVSKYAVSNEVQKIKDRLVGTGKAKKASSTVARRRVIRNFTLFPL